MDERDQILEKLAQLPLEAIDKKRDKKTLELHDVLNELHKAKDEELTLKHTKRKVLVEEGHSLHRVEQLLRGDDELYSLKRLILAKANKKNTIKLELEILQNLFWKARA